MGVMGIDPREKCRAWAKVNGFTGAIIAGYGVASVTRNGPGDYTVVMSSAMPSAIYSVLTTVLWSNWAASNVSGVDTTTAPTSTSFRVGTAQNGSKTDFDFSFGVFA